MERYDNITSGFSSLFHTYFILLFVYLISNLQPGRATLSLGLRRQMTFFATECLNHCLLVVKELG